MSRYGLRWLGQDSIHWKSRALQSRFDSSTRSGGPYRHIWTPPMIYLELFSVGLPIQKLCFDSIGNQMSSLADDYHCVLNSPKNRLILRMFNNAYINT